MTKDDGAPTGVAGELVAQEQDALGPAMVVLSEPAVPTDPGDAEVQARALHRGGIALVANGAFNGLLGLAYWIEAAHLYGAVPVGRNSSLISAMLTISGVAQLNYSRSLSGLIPRAGTDAGRLLARVYVVVGAISLALGLAFALSGPSISSRFAYLTIGVVPVFVAAVVLWSVFTLQDTVLASVRRAPLIPVKNGTFGVVKLVLLYVLAKLGVGQFGIFTSWVIPLVFIIVPIDLHIFRRAIPRIATTTATAVSVTARWVKLDLAGYFFWLFGTSPLPILVLTVLGPKPAASFYIPLTISTAVDLLSLNVGNTVTAEIARDHGRVGPHAVKTLVRVWLLVVVGCVTIAVLAPHLLQLFGGHYRSHGGTALRFLVLAAPARSLMFFSNALARAQEQGGRILLTQAVAATGTLALGLGLMPSMGVPGMAVAWLSSSCVAGILALRWVTPVVLSAWRRPSRH